MSGNIKEMERFQFLIHQWVQHCFGDPDIHERACRFLEEAVELFQSVGGTEMDAHALVNYVFGRPIGEPFQEVGGVMTTLGALCGAADISLHSAAWSEAERIHTPEVIHKVRTKSKNRPHRSPLPGEFDAT